MPMPALVPPLPPSWLAAARRTCLVAAAAAFAAMSWAAAHDILSGEQDVTAEWTWLVFGGLLCGCWLMGRLLRARERPR
jgi:hypothetical protein